MKLEFVREQLAQHQADAFLVINHEHSGQPNARYLAGFSGSECMVLVTNNKQFLLVDGRYTVRGKQESPDFEMVVVERGKAYDSLAKVLDKEGIQKLIIDPANSWYQSVLQLQEKASDVNILPVKNLLMQLRQCKTQGEIQKLQASAEVACKAFLQLMQEIRPGMTERFIAARLEFIMKEMGADKYSFDTIVASGKMGAFPHYVPSDKTIQAGELVTIDWGCYLDGFASDMTRTIAIGEVSDKLKEIHEVVRVSQQKGLDAANTRISGVDLDKVCRDYIKEKGYEEYFVHGTGHGLGLDVHEYPMVNSTNDELLPASSVISIEPGIYIEDLGGVRIEDCIVVQENGHLNLNDLVPKNLITIEA